MKPGMKMELRWNALALFAATLLLLLSASAQSQSVADARALLSAGKAKEARSGFEAALAVNPADIQAQTGEVEACEMVALALRSEGSMDRALEELMRAKIYAPTQGRLFYDLGILEDEMQLFHDADAALDEAARLGLATPELDYARARTKMDLGQLAPAEEHMVAYLKKRPGDASAHYGLGRIYQVGLQMEKAKAEFLRSVELAPQQTESYFELGDLALKSGDLAEAQSQFAKTLALDPHHGGALQGSGETFYKQKQYDKAYEKLKEAAAVSPDYAPCHYYLGLTLNRLGRRDEGQAELKQAAAMTEAENAQAQKRLQGSAAQ